MTPLTYVDLKKKINMFVKNSNNPNTLNVFKFLPPNNTKVHLFVVSSVAFNAYILPAYFFKT